MLVLAPSRSPELVRESRRLIRAAREHPEALFDADGGVRVLGVGELLAASTAAARRRRRRSTSARTIEEVLALAPLDFVHVHEPFAPSASSVALRHSRALNVGSFHAPTERVLSTQVARRFVELFFGRLDARTASFEATRELMERSFPAAYRLLRPGAPRSTDARAAPDAGPLRIAFCAPGGARRAAAVPARAAAAARRRRLGGDRLLARPARRPTGALRSRVRDRVQVVTPRSRPRTRCSRRADVAVAASLGHGARPGPAACARSAPAPSRCASRLRAYEEVLDDGDLGLLFEPGDVDVLAAPARAAGARPRAAARGCARACDERRDGALAGRASPTRSRRSTSELAARRRPTEGDPELRARLRERDADRRRPAHAHRPLARLRDAGRGAARHRARARASARSRSPTTTRSPARSTRARKAAEYGVKVIVGEEVKTADQGEVIGLFIEEKIPRGLTLEETIAEIKRQGGLVYVPHPFDRLHSVPDYEHLLAVVDDIDAIEVFNPRIAIPAFNEEAVRFAGQVPDRRRRRLGRARRAGARRGPHPDARLRRARRSSSSRCATPTSSAGPPRCTTRRCRR